MRATDEGKVCRVAVFSGGGVKGAFQLGAVKGAFEAHPDLRFDATFGVSTGALNAALIAQGTTRKAQIAAINQGLKIYAGIRGNNDVVRGSRFLPIQAINFLTRGYLYDPTPLKLLMHGAITSGALKRGIHCGFGIVDLLGGSYHSTHGTDWRYGSLFDKLMASCAMPGYMPPVKMFDENGDPMLAVDGGLRNITPLKDAVDWLRPKFLPAEPHCRLELWLFLANPLRLKAVDGVKGGPGVVGRTLGIILNEVYRSDLDELVSRNDNWQSRRPWNVPVNVSVAEPLMDYGSSLDFDPLVIADMVQAGLVAGHEMPAPSLSGSGVPRGE